MARKPGLVWAMEELTEQMAPAAVEEELGSDNLETELLDVTERSNEIEDANTSIEEAVEDIDTLEDIASVLDESKENGGTDQVGARIAQISVESILARLDVNPLSKVFPAMESFGNKESRIGVTRISVENVKEGVKAAWVKIQEIAAKVWNWITDFLGSIFNSAGKLKDRAAELLAKVTPLKGQKPTETNVECEADFSHLIKSLKIAEELAAAAQANSDALNKELVDPSLVGAAESVEGLEKVKTDDLNLKGFTKTDSDKEDMQAFTTGELPNGDTITVEVPKSGLTGKAALTAKMLALVSKYTKGKVKPATEDNSVSDVKFREYPTATPEEMAQVCEKVGVFAKALEFAKSGLGKIKAAGSAFLSLVKSIPGKLSEATQDIGGLLQRACSAVSRAVSGFFSKLYGSLVGSGKFCLDWVEKNYKAYKAKPEAVAA